MVKRMQKKIGQDQTAVWCFVIWWYKASSMCPDGQLAGVVCWTSVCYFSRRLLPGYTVSSHSLAEHINNMADTGPLINKHTSIWNQSPAVPQQLTTADHNNWPLQTLVCLRSGWHRASLPIVNSNSSHDTEKPLSRYYRNHGYSVTIAASIHLVTC